MANISRDIAAVRKENLKRLAEQHGGVNALAQKLGYANGSFLVQMIGPNPTRAVTEKTVRGIEEKLGLPAATLDGASGTASFSTLNADHLTTILVAVDAACRQLNIRLEPNKHADVVAFVYRDFDARRQRRHRPSHDSTTYQTRKMNDELLRAAVRAHCWKEGYRPGHPSIAPHRREVGGVFTRTGLWLFAGVTLGVLLPV